MAAEITPNLQLVVPSDLETPGSIDVALNENLRKIDQAVGDLVITGGGGITLVIQSTYGDVIPSNPDNSLRKTILTARVFSSNGEITDQYTDNRFVWKRQTVGQPLNNIDDQTFNLYYNLHRARIIEIFDTDILNKATFYCELMSEDA